jgi:flagellar FliL protein
MSTPEKPPQDPTAEQAEPPKKKRGKLLLITGVLTILLGAGGGAGWYFTRPADPNAPKAVEKPKPAIFMALESFTVNLVPTDGQAQYVQAGLTLKLDDTEAADLIKERMPQVRDRVLMVISSKRSTDLLSTQGKQKLAAEISDAVKNVIVPAMKPRVATDKPGALPLAPIATAAAAETPAAEDKDKPTDAKAAEAETAEASKAEAKTAEAKAADTKTAEAKTKDGKPARPPLVIEVLFTAFIIQ